MDDALELADYLPLSYKTPTEQEYIAFLWDAFHTNVQAQKWPFAFLAYHMLAMSFVYFNLWQVRHTREDQWRLGMIGFGRDERDIDKALTPFTLSKLNESHALRLLRLIECDDQQIKRYVHLVRARNENAHASGQVRVLDETALSDRVTDILTAVGEIQDKSEPVIRECYTRFLTDHPDPDEWEYDNAEDQVREVLVHGRYLSTRDIAVCRAVDPPAAGADSEGAALIHTALGELYPPED